MVGNIPALVNPNENTSNSATMTVPGEILYIPLEFWFCRNPGLNEEIGQKSTLPSPRCAQGWESKLVEHVLAAGEVPQVLVLCTTAKSDKTKLIWKPLTRTPCMTLPSGIG